VAATASQAAHTNAAANDEYQDLNRTSDPFASVTPAFGHSFGAQSHMASELININRPHPSNLLQNAWGDKKAQPARIQSAAHKRG